jgi:hypothetical protein
VFSLGCGQKDEPTESDYNDVALAVGSMVAGNGSDGEVGEMTDVIALSGGEMPDGMTASGDGTINGQRGTLTYSFAIDCKDAAGATQSECDETTDQAAVQVDWSGSIDWPRYDATVTRTGDWTLSNIQSGVAEFNGDGTFDVDSEFTSLDGNRTRTFQLAYAANYDGILIDVDTHVVQGGVASYSIAASRTASNRFRDVEAEFDMDAVVTFHGNGSATLELDRSRSYNIDLNSGAVTGL